MENPVAIGIDVNHTTKRVVIGFDQSVSQLIFTPMGAVKFAEALVTKAMELEPKGHNGHDVTGV